MQEEEILLLPADGLFVTKLAFVTGQELFKLHLHILVLPFLQKREKHIINTMKFH